VMIFCRGCGKEVHNSALMCPHCGAPQAAAATSGKDNDSKWASITSFVWGVISFLLILDEPGGRWDHDTIIGGLFLGGISATFGVIALAGKQSAQWMAISGLILGLLVILVTIGSG
jgi:hypothetical protein